MADDTSPMNGNYIGSDGALHNLDGGAGLEPCEANRYMSPFYGVFIGSDGQEHGLEEISSGGGGNVQPGLPADTTTDEIPEGDDNLYYTNDRVDQRIQAANLAPRSQILAMTLLGDGWSNNMQTLQNSSIASNMNGLVVLAQGATTEQYEAWSTAQIMVTGQSEGAIVFTSYATAPTIDVPIGVLLLG